jgi:hypothetical protein
VHPECVCVSNHIAVFVWGDVGVGGECGFGCWCGCGLGCTQVSAVRYSDCGDFLFSGSYDRSSKVCVCKHTYSILGHIWDTHSVFGHILFLALMILDLGFRL